uniref:DUF3699 domain-containing protein n=1 Tax=Macrostomum lignano TaxID=282301 RepID=A0A1I8J940_9PLAT
MAGFAAESVFQPGAIQADVGNLHLGEPNAPTASCTFRSVTWTPPKVDRRSPLVIQTTTPVEILRGIQIQDAGEFLAGDREAVAIGLSSSAFCSKFLQCIKQVERGIAIKLKQMGDPMPLLRISRATEEGDLGFAHLYRQKESKTWRLGLALRSLTLVDDDPKHLPMLAQALRFHIPTTSTPIAATAATEEEESTTTTTLVKPVSGRKRRQGPTRRSPAKRPTKTTGAATTAAAAEDWITVTPVKDLVSGVTNTVPKAGKAAASNPALGDVDSGASTEPMDSEDDEVFAQ